MKNLKLTWILDKQALQRGCIKAVMVNDFSALYKAKIKDLV